MKHIICEMAAVAKIGVSIFNKKRKKHFDKAQKADDFLQYYKILQKSCV